MNTDGKKMDDGATPGTWFDYVRIAGGIIGLVAIVAGVACALLVFQLIYIAVKTPDLLEPGLARWARAIGGDELSVTIGDKTVAFARPVAIMIMGASGVAMAWLAMGIALVGAKVVSWTISDVETMKKLLKHAFGPTMKP